MNLPLKTPCSTLVMIILGWVAIFLEPANGLTCWKTPGSGFMNKMDPSRPIEERTCLESEKSCQSEMYNVGRHWYVKMGCSNQDQTECTTEVRGAASEKISCFCSSDYCNSSSNLKTDVALVVFAASLMLFFRMSLLK